MIKLNTALSTFVAFVPLLGHAIFCQATDYTYAPTGNAYWEPNDWTSTPSGGIPNSESDRAIFDITGGGSTNLHPQNPTVRELRFNTPGNWHVFNNNRNLYLNAPGGGPALITQNNSGTVTFDSDLVLVDNTILGGTGSGTVNANGSYFEKRAFDGAGSLTKTGSFTLNINSPSYHTGGTIVSAGTVSATNSNALGSGTLVINGGTLNTSVNLSNDITLNATNNTIAANGNYRILSGKISGAGGFTVANGGGAAGLQLTNAANDFAGDVTISGNQTYLRLTASEVIPDTANVINNGQFRLEGGGLTETIAGLSGAGTVWIPNNSSNHTLRVGAGDTSSTFDGTLGQAGQNNSIRLQKIGDGIFTLTNNNNRFNGGVDINGGTLSVSQLTPGNNIGQLGAALGVSSFLTFDGGTLEYTGGTVGGINRAFTINSGGATIDITNATTTVTWTDGSGAGPITGVGQLTKAGPGTLLLTGSHNYTGSTSVSQGTLTIGTGGALTQTAGVSLTGGATLNVENGASLTSTGQVFLGNINTSLNVAGSLTAASLFAPWATSIDVDGMLSGGNVTITSGSTVPITGSGTFNATSFVVGNFATANFGMTGELNNSGDFYLNNNQGTGNFTQTAGTVNLTSTTADDIRIGHWPTGTATYAISGGTLNATGVDTVLGWDGDGVLTVSGTGTANLRGIRLGNTQTAGNHGGDGTINVNTGGTLNIGAGGITSGGTGAKAINLSGGTLGALANWSTGEAMTLTAGTTSTIDTTGGDIALSGALTGTGNLIKVADGTLTLTGVGSNFGSLLVQRAAGASETSTVSLAGAGSTTVTFVGVGNPNSVGGLAGSAVLNVQDTHSLQVNGNLYLGERTGNPGTLTQSGGSINVTGEVRVAHWPNETSVYNMTGGSLTVGGLLSVGRDGIGDMDVTGDAIVNANGDTHIQNGSTLTVGGDAVFNSPNIQVGQLRGNGTLEVQGNGTINADRLDVGNPSGVSGQVSQTGGLVDLAGTTIGTDSVAMRLGHWDNETSTYDISGGELRTTSNLYIGWDGNGIFTANGDALVNTGDLLVGTRGGNGSISQSGNSVINVNNTTSYVVGANGDVDHFGNSVTNVGNPIGGGNTQIGASSGTGMYTLRDSGVLNNYGNLTVETAGTFNLQDNGVLNFGDTAAGTQSTTTPDALFASTLTVDGDGAFNFNGGTLQNVTTIDVTSATGTAFSQDGGDFVIGVDGNLATDGTATRAITTITGDFEQSAGNLLVDIFGSNSHGFNGESAGTLAIDVADPMTDLDSDLLHVMGDATLNGILDVDANELGLAPFAWYDVVLADGMIDLGDDFDIADAGDVSFFRVIDDPFGPGQLLQVAVPEPASIAIWTLLGLALGAFGYTRMRKKA